MAGTLDVTMAEDERERKAGGGMRSEDGNPTPAVFPPPESLRPTLMGDRYMVSAGHPLVAQAAAMVFERGGNAIDAGVAGGMVANVVQADMCNFGGVAPILVRQAGSDRVWSISGLGTWGRDASVEAFRARYGDEMPLGGAVALVPAAPDAWITALERFGTWSFAAAAAAAPAIAYATDGFIVDQRTAQALEIFGRGFSHWPSSRAVYWPAGRPPRAGERLRQPALATLLGRLAGAEVGGDRAAALDAVRQEFYQSDIAARLVEFVRRDGGWLTVQDLADYRSDVAPAVSRGYAGYEVFTTDTWTQGPALLQALAILEGMDLAALGHNSAAYLHRVTEAIKLSFSDRERYYGDPRVVDVDLPRLLSDEHAAELRARIAPEATLPNLPTLDASAGHRPARRDTTYLCAIDAEGNAFSATPSDTIDGGPIVPDLGIIVSPRGVQSRAWPGHPAALAAGKRPRLTPAPALALRHNPAGDDMVMAFGSPGGDVILQAMLQTFLNVAHFGMTPQQAVEAPRVISFSFPGSFYPFVEVQGRLTVEDRIDPAVRATLASYGHQIVTWPSYEFDAGAVSLVLDLLPPSAEGRVLAAAADPRRSCYAVGR